MDQIQVLHSLGVYKTLVEDTWGVMKSDQIMARIWDHDHTVWQDNPEEITNRLGWLHVPHLMLDQVDELQRFAQEIISEGFQKAVLLGMGGSSLAPEVFQEIFGPAPGFLDLEVLDTTDPDAIRTLANELDLNRTLFIVATKSGGTVETLSLFKYFYNIVGENLGLENAGSHFIAITDPGSRLENLAEQHGFRKTFKNDPNIGGRFSALSYFGLVPASLLGVDLDLLLQNSLEGLCSCESCDCALDENNYAAEVGGIIGGLAKIGRDKLTFVISPEIESFGNWVEQLIAESTGKQGTGIVPIVGEPVGDPEQYGDDRLFIYLRLGEDQPLDKQVQRLAEAGQPVVWIQLEDLYGLGGQFFLWELATAVAGHLLGINPFDQPNVESAKIRAREMVSAYQETGTLPKGKTTPITLKTMEDFITKSVQSGSYLAIQAYLNPTSDIQAALQALRMQLGERFKLPTTLGFGPRFLHSTGQLHKGDAGKGVFIQFISLTGEDLPIPDQAGEPGSSMGFGVLKNAQALGDAGALEEAGRKIICFDLGKSPQHELQSLNKD
jgi:glucose-6-phosphate isomerase